MKDWLKLGISNRSFSSDELRKKWLERTKSVKGKEGSRLAKESDGEVKGKYIPLRGSVRKKIQEFEANKEDDEKTPFKPKHTSELESLIEIVDSFVDDETSSSAQLSFFAQDSSASQLHKSQRCTSVEVLHESATVDETSVEQSEEIEPCIINHSDVVDDEENCPLTHIDDGNDSLEVTGNEEPLYVSRKLLMRQIIEEELKNSINNDSPDSEQEDIKSLADSWSEMEENFTRIYEPVPFDIRMNSWRQMNKKQILSKVSSKRLVEEMNSLTRDEILEKIEQVRDLAFAGRLTNVAYSSSDDQVQTIQVVAQVHHDDRKGSVESEDAMSEEEENAEEREDFSEDDNNSSRSELYRSIRDLERCLESHTDQPADDSTSWNSIATNDDGTEEPVYVSRSEILSRHDPIYSSRPEVKMVKGFHPIYETRLVTPEVIHLPFPPVSRKAILNNATRENYLIETLSRQLNGLSGKGTSYFSRSQVVSHLMQTKEKRRGGKSSKNIRNNSKEEDACTSHGFTTFQEISANAVPQRTNSSASTISFDSWSLDFSDESASEADQKSAHCKDLEDKHKPQFREKNSSRDSWSFSESEELAVNAQNFSRTEILNKGMRLRESPALELQRRVEEILSMHDHIETPTKEKVMHILSEHIKKNVKVESLADAEEKNREMRDKLKKALAKDWETLSNINLGFIYVPMEESSKMPSKELTDYDTFGSLDSLIFEPKPIASGDSINASKVIQESVLKSTDSEQVNKKPSNENVNFGGKTELDSRTVKEFYNSDHIDKLTVIDKELDIGKDSADEVISLLDKIDRKNYNVAQLEEKCISVMPSPSLLDTKEKKTITKDAATKVETSKKKLLWMRLHKGFTDGFFKSSSKNLESFFGNTKESVSPQMKNKPQSTEYNYHPDHVKKVLSIGGNTSSLESTSIDSDTESITSIESVIFNAKLNSKDTEEDNIRKNLSKKYVVNQCTESDSSSEQEKGSQGNSSGQNLLDSDTSWDYIEPQKAAEFRKALLEEEKNASKNPGDNSENKTSYQNVHMLVRQEDQFEIEPKNNNEASFENCEEFIPGDDRNLNPRKDPPPKLSQPPLFPDSDQENVYEECRAISPFKNVAPVSNPKHHIYQSLDSVLSPKLKKIATNVSFDSDLQHVKHTEAFFGTTNSRLFSSMNGAYIDQNSHERPSSEDPFVVRNGKVFPLTEEIFRGTIEREKKELAKPDGAYLATTNTDSDPIRDDGETSSGEGYSTKDSLESNDVFEKPTDIESVSASSMSVEAVDKIKKVQRFGVSLMGNENNDLMIRELKLKLKRRFNAEDELDKESDLKYNLPLGSLHRPLQRDESANSVASKREQLAPHMSKIFNSFNVKRNQLNSTSDSGTRTVEDQIAASKDTKELKQELNELTKEHRISGTDLIVAEIGDSIIWIPTPDYTPLSTLHRNSDEEESPEMTGMPFFFASSDTTFDYSDLERFVEVQLKGNRSSSPSRIPEPALLMEEHPDNKARSGSSKRSVRFDTSLQLQEPSLGATWSDLESVIFAEDRSFSSETFEHGGRRPSSPLAEANEAAVLVRLPESRMESYKDDWLLWDQLAKMRKSKSPEDRERWQTEKTKRMLLWIHLSNNDIQREWCYKSQWWKAKQKASVSWIVQKAHKNKVPSDIEDPYYKDYEGQERPKPGIVHRLSNADLYCSALANIYGDPNFHNLSHWNIIQALARKGVYVAEPTDVALTETVLIQTTPIKMSAHLAVIEAMMALYIREVVIAERVVQAIQRISGIPQSQGIPTPQDQEEALVLWVEHTTQALQTRIHQQVQPSQGQELPVFPKIQDLSDLSDGIGLAALVAFYCPHELSWADIAVADPPSMADSLYNISLVIKFCHESLPYNPCLLTKEDIVYMHSSVKQNILAFVAELFFLMELEPVSCVSIPNTKKTSTKYIQLSSPGYGGRYSSCSGGNSGWSGYQRSGRIIPDLRQSVSPSSTPSAHSTHSTGSSSSFSAPSSTHSHHHRSSYASSLRDNIGVRETSNCGLRRQLSLTERDRPRKERVSVHDGMKPAGVPSVRRSHSMNLNDVADSRSRAESRSENAPSSHNSDYGGRESSMSDGQEGEFLVQRAKGYSTLNDMMRNQSSPRPSQTESSHDFFVGSRGTTKERYNNESKEEELGERRLSRRGSFYGSSQELNELPPAGIPSRLEQRPLGRSRSRRNSINAEESQLTIENFGGSQDNLNYASRNPDKEVYVHSGKRDSQSSIGSRERRSSSQSRERNEFHTSLDELDNRVIDKLEKDALEKEKRERRISSRERPVKERRKGRMESAPDSSSESEASFDPDKPVGKATSFAELSKLKEQLPGGINIIYMQSERDEGSRSHAKEKKTTFAALPNQTTWKQQSVQSQVEDNSDATDDNMEPQVVSSELHNVKLKLEEKRRRIEAEKRKMEMMMNKQRQKLGKEAFMQAVVKGAKGTSSTGSSTPTTTSEPDPTEILADSVEQSLCRSRIPHSSPLHSTAHAPVAASSSLPILSTSSTPPSQTHPTVPVHPTHTKTPPISSPPNRPNTILSLKDLGTEVSNVSKRWLEGGNHMEELKTPDLDAMDYEDYQKSLTQDPTAYIERGPKIARHTSVEYHGSPSRSLSRPDYRRFSLYLEPGSSGDSRWHEETREYSPHPGERNPHMPPLPPPHRRVSGEYLPPPYRMTDSLTEIQTDIQRLSHQQQQIQSMMQNGVANQHPQNVHSQHQNQFYLHDQQQGSPARRMWGHQSGGDSYASMSPATRRAQWGPVRPMMPQPEYMMSGPPQSAGYYYQMNQPPMQLPPLNQMGQPPPPPPHGQGTGFMLHGQPQSLPAGHQPNMYQNGQNFYSPEQYRGFSNQGYDPPRAPPLNQGSNTPFRLHNEGTPGTGDDSRGPSSLRSSAQSSPSRQGQFTRQQKSPSPSRQVIHAPVSAPPPDDMEPQHVCFIDTEEGDKLKRLSISSGSRTYRISHEPGSPTRPQLGTKTFRVPTKKGTPVYDDSDLPQPSPPQRSLSPPYQSHYSSQEADDDPHVEPLVEGSKADKGFYISLDDNPGPKRPKPQLRTKKLSQKKNSAPTTPLSTPSREDAPPIPDQSSLRSPSGGSILDNSPSFGSLKLRRDSSSRSMPHSMASPTYSSTLPTFTLRSDVTPSPSSSASSIPARNSHCWSPQNARDKINNNNNSSYNFDDYPHGSDTGSDGALEEVTKAIVAKKKSDTSVGMALVIGEDLVNEDSSLSEMEKKKEKLMMMSMRRKQQQEEMRRKKEMEAEMKREEEKIKEDLKQRKKEEEKARRELILERHKIKKAIEEAEKEGRYYTPPAWYQEDSGSNTPTTKHSSVRMRSKPPGGTKPRPKTMHEGSLTGSEERLASGGKKGSSHNLADPVRKSSGRWGSSNSLSRSAGNRGSTGSIGPEYSSSSASRTLDRHSGRRPTSVIDSNGSLMRRERSKGSLYGSRSTGLEDHDLYRVHETRRPSLASPRARYRYNVASAYDSSGSASPRKYRSTGNLYGHSEHESLLYHMSEDSGLGRATPPRRVPSPGMSSRHLPSPSGPGSLPPGLFSRRRPGAFDDNMSDISATSSNIDYCGPRLFKQPTAKSNRNIILNAVEYCVFPGVVNQTAKQRVLEEVARSESKHFLILFRDAGCQFRAMYSYNPDLEEVFKLYGTGPKQVTDRMFDKFFKYNSGGKCFSQIHTKHLTVTIDAFTIHNSLWQGKKVNLPSKKDMKLVI